MTIGCKGDRKRWDLKPAMWKSGSVIAHIEKWKEESWSERKEVGVVYSVVLTRSFWNTGMEVFGECGSGHVLRCE